MKHNITLSIDREFHSLNPGSGFITLTEPAHALSLSISREESIPQNYTLEQPYPNPFNPSTTVRYSLPVDSRVRLRVYNILGQLVATLAEGLQESGTKAVLWNADGAVSGVYFVRLDAAGAAHEDGRSFTRVVKVMMQK